MKNLIRNSKRLKKQLRKMIQAVFSIVFFSVLCSLNAQNSTRNDNTHNILSTSKFATMLEKYKIEYSIDWQTLMLTSKIHTNISDDLSSTESLYFLQSVAYKKIEETLPSILLAIINTLPLSSQNSLQKFMKQYNIYTAGLNNIYMNTSRIHHILDKNFFGLTVLYTSKLMPFIMRLLLPQFSNISIPQEASLHGILRGDATTRYTHLIFSIEKPLPVLQKKSEQKLFNATFMPRVIAENGRIVYTPEYFEGLKQSANTENFSTIYNTAELPFQYMYEEKTKDVSFIKSALIIIPIALNNKIHPDIVISNEDAHIILGSEILRETIRSGKVIFIISSMDKNFTNISK